MNKKLKLFLKRFFFTFYVINSVYLLLRKKKVYVKNNNVEQVNKLSQRKINSPGFAKKNFSLNDTKIEP